MVVWILVAALALVLAAGTAVLSYFLIVIPRKWKRPLAEVAELIHSEQRDDLERADRLLTEAMGAGPRGSVLDEARFAQAFVRAMLGAYNPDEYTTASAAVKDLVLSEGYGPSTAYLDLWLRTRTANDQQACELYEEQSQMLAARPESRRVAAVSYLRLAHQHWGRREMDGAIHYFDRVRDLGELADQIPAGIDDLQLVKGVQAAFDGRTDAAREAFVAARERAERLGADTKASELGMLLCDWKTGDIADPFESLERLHYRLGDAGEDQSPLLAPVALLRLVALLRTWRSRRAFSGGLSRNDLNILDRCARAAREADPDGCDADLIEGLIRYYFAASEEERESGLRLLEQGREPSKGIALPEVLDLIRRERELGGSGDAIDRYLQLLSDLQRDPARTEADRTEYRRLKQRFAEFGNVLDEEDVPAATDPARSDEYERRVEMLRRRLRLVVYPQVRDLPEDDPVTRELRSLEEGLASAADRYSRGVQRLQSTELELVKLTGAVLLPEEEHEDPLD